MFKKGAFVVNCKKVKAPKTHHGMNSLNNSCFRILPYDRQKNAALVFSLNLMHLVDTRDFKEICNSQETEGESSTGGGLIHHISGQIWKQIIFSEFIPIYEITS